MFFESVWNRLFADIVHPFNTDTLAANSDPLLYLREPDVLIVAFNIYWKIPFEKKRIS